MKDNLKVITNIKKTILYLDKIIINMPNSDIVLKDNLKKAMYNVLEYAYMASLDSKYKLFIISKIKMVDFYLKISFEKKYISYKKYEKVSNYLLEILKMVYGWLNYEKV